VHAFDFLSDDDLAVPAGVVVLYGDEPFLKQLVRRRLQSRLFGEDAETPIATFPGEGSVWRDVADELRTVSLFGGGGRRLVVVEDADPFVTEHRGRLEELAARTGLPGTLLLDVSTWTATTRLAKIVGKQGLAIECRAPRQGGRSKGLDTGRTIAWLVAWGRSRHGVQMPAKTAGLLLELVGPEFGLLDQELAKLALFVEPGGKVSTELVTQVVGGWRMQTTWEMIDAALEGRTSEALEQLDRLLLAGQQPQALFGSISWSLRRFAAATRVYERSLRAGRRMALGAALEQAGLQHWQVQKAETQIKRLGRRRAGQLYRWLLETDLALKGSHSAGDRARWMLERLLLRLAPPPAAPSSGGTSGRPASSGAR
jgi:DNA polymerase-3 subunit delta